VEQLGSHWADFLKILYLTIFRKSVEKIQVLLQIGQESQQHKAQYAFLVTSRSVILRMKNVSDESSREIKTHVFFKNFSYFFFLNRDSFQDNVEKYFRTCKTQMTTWRMRVACWIPAARHTVCLCNTHCLSTAGTFPRTRLNFMLNARRLSVIFSAWDSFSDALSCVLCLTDVPHCCSSFLCFIVRNVLALICLMIVMDCCCEVCDEHVGSLKYGEFLASWETTSFSWRAQLHRFS